MQNGSPERRLAAIVAIDVVGYSRLMGADEAGTLNVLKAHQDILTPMVVEHGGRLVSTAGDGLLLEFPSVVEALDCSIKIQTIMEERNTDIPEEQKMLFRIGVNLGDIIIHTDNDVFGDGVNVAARIEQLAPPGGICISRTVRNHVRDRMSVNLEDKGEIKVKNIVRPIRVFRVLKEGEVAAPRPKIRPVWQKYTAIAAVVVALIAGGIGLWWQVQPDFEPADPNKYAFKLPEKPSIAVLPFDNLTGDNSQDYLGDAITENIITVLTTSPDLFVIARNSSFKRKTLKVQKVAEELGVRYVLEGNVQKSGNKLRVTAQLVDAVDGKHIWAKRYDKVLAEFFAVQDEIAHEILVAMHVKLTVGENAANIWQEVNGDPIAYKQIIEGRSKFQTFSRTGNREAEKLYRKAYEKHPDSAATNTYMGWLYWQKTLLGFTENAEADKNKVRTFAQRAIALNDRYADAYRLLASLDVAVKKYDEAIVNADHALALTPGDGAVMATMGYVKQVSGRTKESIVLLRNAMRYEPDYPHWVPYALVISQMMLGRYEEVKKSANDILTSETEDVRAHPGMLRMLAAIAVFEGDMTASHEYIKRLLELNPTANITPIKRRMNKYREQDFVTRYIDALRLAGLPENPPVKTPDKPSIAVLPFANLSDDKDQEYFADGMTDDLITDLSKISGIDVIARNSVFTYKGKNVKAQEVARDLNVSHVLEGSVRRAGDKVRINAQLIDAATGAHLWAETFDREYQDIFALQDEVTSKIVEALKVNLTKEEQEQLAKRGTQSIEAYEELLKARAFQNQLDLMGKGLSEALAHFQAAINIDPTYSEAYAGDAAVALHVWRHNMNWVLVGKEAQKRAEQSILRALKFNPNNAEALSVKASLLTLEGNVTEAEEIARYSVQQNPKDAQAFISLAQVLTINGKPDEALPYGKKALKLVGNPAPVDAIKIGWVLFHGGELEEALRLFQRASELTPKAINAHAGLAATYAKLGNISEANMAIKKLRAVYPPSNLNSIRFYYKYYDKKITENWLSAMKLAGATEWPFGFVGDPNLKLTGEEIRRQFYGRETKSESKLWGEMSSTIHEDGSMSLYIPKYKLAQEFKGRIVEDTYCQREGPSVRGQEFCSHFYWKADAEGNKKKFIQTVNIFGVWEGPARPIQ
jgi:adenylate cyclase